MIFHGIWTKKIKIRNYDIRKRRDRKKNPDPSSTFMRMGGTAKKKYEGHLQKTSDGLTKNRRGSADGKAMIEKIVEQRKRQKRK